jgi:hypothetical protein
MRRLALASIALATVACQQPAGRSLERPPVNPPSASLAPLDLDLSQVIDRVRRGVRRDGDRLTARGDHHQLSVEATGRVRVTTLGAGGAALQLETTAITRGGRVLTGGALARAEGTTVVVARGAVEEQLENRAGGVEQRWRLATRPAGAGDLTVSVRASGLAWVGATAGGLHFGDPAAGMVRYGLASWVDAAGARTSLATRFAAGTIQVTVPAALLDGAAYPAVIDPVVSAERAVDQPPLGAGASGSQEKPSVACLTTGTCLVAWRDTVLQSYGAGAQLRGARLSGSPLTLLDPNGFDIDPGSSTVDCGAPVVVEAAVGGTKEFAVVYGAGVQTGLASWTQRVMLARVSAAGTLPASPIQLSLDANGSAWNQSVSSDGSTVAVAWNDLQEIRFRTVVEGAATGTAPVIPIPRSSVPSGETAFWDRPAITWSGDAWFLAWRGGLVTGGGQIQVVRVAFLDAAGTYLPAFVNGSYFMGSNPAGVMDAFAQPVLASDRAGHVLALAAWRNGLDPYPGQVLGMRFAKGSVDWVAWPIGGIPGVFPTDEVSGLTAWWNGTAFSVLLQYQVSGGQSAQLRTYPATPFNAPYATTLAAATTTQVFPAANAQVGAIRATGDGVGGTLLAWEDTSSGIADVRAARLGATDPRPGSLLLTSGAADENAPAAAYDAGVWLVAWEDKRTVAATGAGDIFGVRLRQADGVALDAAALNLSSATGYQGGPVAAGGGGGFLVAWQDGRAVSGTMDIWATRVTTAGAIAFPAGVALTTDATHTERPVAAAFDGTDYHLLHTVEATGAPPLQVLRDSRVQPADLLVKSTVDVATPLDPNHHLRAQLGCRSDGCLAAWSEELGTVISARAIQGGALAGTQSTLATGLPTDPSPAVSAATSGSPAFLVGWAEADGTAMVTTVKALAVALDGTAATSPVTLASGATGAASQLAASFDGTDHALSWAPSDGGLFTGWVRAAGSARASATQLVPGGLSAPRSPVSSAGDGEGRTLIAYTAFDPTPGVRANRVKVRLASYAKLLGNPCTTAGECGSGFCVEGVCCDTACSPGASGCQTCSARNGHGTAGHCAVTLNDACDDGVACTSGDHCNAAAACVGTSYACTATQCQASSSCDGLGGCAVVNKPDTTACDDGNPCTYADQCSAGACAGTPITCSPGSCDVSSSCNGTSACTVTRKPDNASCSDGNPCTLNDTCQSGSCVPGSPKLCPALADPCKGAGSCDPASGGCVYAAAPDGTTCAAGTCQGGACQAGPGAVLGMSCGAGPAGGEALLLGLAMLGLLTRRAWRRS